MKKRLYVGRKKVELDLGNNTLLSIKYSSKKGFRMTKHTMGICGHEDHPVPMSNTGTFVVDMTNGVIEYEQKKVSEIREKFDDEGYPLDYEVDNFYDLMDDVDDDDDFAVVYSGDDVVAARTEDLYWFDKSKCTLANVDDLLYGVFLGQALDLDTRGVCDISKTEFSIDKPTTEKETPMVEATDAEVEYFWSNAFINDLICNHHKRNRKDIDYTNFRITPETAKRFGIKLNDWETISPHQFIKYETVDDQVKRYITANMRDYFEMMWAMVDLYEEHKTWLHVKYKGFKPDETVYNTVKLIIGDPDRWSPAHVNRVLFWLGGKLNDTNV